MPYIKEHFNNKLVYRILPQKETLVWIMDFREKKFTAFIVSYILNCIVGGEALNSCDHNSMAKELKKKLMKHSFFWRGISEKRYPKLNMGTEDPKDCEQRRKNVRSLSLNRIPIKSHILCNKSLIYFIFTYIWSKNIKFFASFEH